MRRFRDNEMDGMRHCLYEARYRISHDIDVMDIQVKEFVFAT